MIATPQSICTRALKLINAVGFEETPQGNVLNLAYDSLRELIDGWAADRLSVLVVERALFDLVSGTQAYTIGTGGMFNRNRPIWLPNASVINNSSANYPLELPLNVMSYDEWQRVPVKNITSALPTAIYYDHAFSATGLATIYVFPIPNVGNLQLALYCPTPLTEFTGKTQSYDFPPAYLRALTYCLAIDIAPLFDINPTQLVMAKAAEYLGDIRRANNQPFLVTVDRALVSHGDLFNYYTGEPF